MADDDEEIPRSPQDPGAVAPENEAVRSHWEQAVADMEATADEYRDRGWTVLEIHPGDVVALGPGQADRWGLDLLVPDDEFGELERWVLEENGSFDACEVFHARGGGIVFLVTAMLDEAARRAVVFPAYYDPDVDEGMMERARATGEMRTHVRTLQADPIVTFRQGDPGLFVPDE